jgi:basic membrane lipoprotein Med (substrate-binding protein (PBP1-ABC) superfamily)
VLTNALDDADTSSLVVRTARSYHAGVLNGKTTEPEPPKKDAKKEVPRGGFIAPDPAPDTATLTQNLLDLVGLLSPDLVILHGGDWKANVGVARANPESAIIDLDQPTPCLSENGQPDTTGECLGGTAALPSNYSATEFAVEEGAYLAGVIAARESKGGSLGIISGSTECLECDRYVTGFINGALSVEPEIDIQLGVISGDEVGGFGDEASAKTYAEAFLEVYEPTVLLPVGRGATMGMVEAACEAGVNVIGAGVDISAERPDFAQQNCVLMSIVPDVARAIEEAMFFFATGGSEPITTYDLQGGGVRVTDEWRLAPTKRVDTNDFYAAAEVAVLTDQVEPCPDGCGVFPPPAEGTEPAA